MPRNPTKMQTISPRFSDAGSASSALIRRDKSCWCLALLLLLSASSWAAHREIDDTGRSVAVPDHVHRVVSLSPSLTDIVYALGARNELVGITDYTDYPREAAAEKPSVGAIVN